MAKILQLKITLKDIEPKIWRRFLVFDDINFNKLHEIIQIIMGWENYHLYSFDIQGIRIELPDEEGYQEYESENSKKVKLNKYVNQEKQKFHYTYDFGDSWEHKIVVEKVLEDTENTKQVPFCIEGERACPPEDCGGTGGYERFLQVLKTGKDPWGENPQELKEWLKGWKPEEFNIKEINKTLPGK